MTRQRTTHAGALSLACLLAAHAAGAVPTTLTYAGVLTQDGAPVDGTVGVVFALFDAEAGGELLYEEEDDVVVVDGELLAELGDNALDDTILAAPELWLEVTIDGTTLEPRVRLNSVPYALRAEAALRAEDALTLGGLAPLDLVTQAQLAQLGLAAGLSAGTGIVINAGTVSIASGGVGATQLASGAVTTAALADGAVTTAKLAAGAVASGKIAAGAVLATHIADSAVTTAALATGAVTGAKIAAGAVDGAKILDGSVGAAELADGAVDASKLQAGAVGATQLASNSVNGSKIADGSVGSADIQDGAIGTAELADDSVTAAKIAGFVPLFQVLDVACVESRLVATLSPVCNASAAGCPGGARRQCGTTACVVGAPLQCPNTFVALVLPP